MHNLICTICNSSFSAKRFDAKTCSPKCRMKRRKSRPKSTRTKREAAIAGLPTKDSYTIDRPCAICETNMVLTGRQMKREMCSDKCRKERERGKSV